MIETTFKRINNILQITIKLIIAVFLIVSSYKYLDSVFANREVDRADGFHALPENSLDIAVIGSSHSQYSFIPNYIYNDLGLYSYVFGTPCQPYEVSVEMLKEIYKTQKPKLIIFEVYTALPLSKACEGDSCYVTASYQVTGEQKQNILSYLPEEKAKEYLNEFINNHNNWRTIESVDELKPLETPSLLETGNTFGYVDAYPKFPVDNYWGPLQYEEEIETGIRQKDQEALNEILKLCKENGSTLMLYKTPVDGITPEDQSILHKIWNWADENNIKHVNFIELAEELGYYMQTHTNSGHAYINGASIITNYLSDFIKENYIDIFNHDDNEILNSKHESMTYELLKGSSLNEYNPIVYLNRIAKYNGIIVIRYNKWAGSMNKTLANKLISLNLMNDEYKQNNYFAVYNNGELIKESTEPFEITINERLIKVDTDHIYMEGVDLETWTGSPMSITIFNEKMDNWFIKRVDTKSIWEYGYAFYGE